MISKVKYNPTSSLKQILEYPGLTVGKIYDIIEYKKSHIDITYDCIIMKNDNGEIKEYFMNECDNLKSIYFEDATSYYRNEIIDCILE